MNTCKGWKMDVKVKWYTHYFGFNHWSIEYGKFSIRRIVRLVRWYIRAGSKETDLLNAELKENLRNFHIFIAYLYNY